jgi:hypothetical protein
MKDQKTKCSTCHYVFSLDSEGGIAGEFGIIPVAFCPTCLASCFDMIDQLRQYDDDCPKFEPAKEEI